MGKIITKILEINPEKIDREKIAIAARAIRQGKTVIFPTETVYGLGANALDGKAVKKIFKAKNRPADNPLIVHIAEKKEVRKLVKRIPQQAKILMEKFWPGPLSLIFEKSDIVPDETTVGLSTVAIRMPVHPIAHELIKLAKVPIAAPSANLSGSPSPTRGEHVIKDMLGRVDIIIDGGNATIGLESTVVDVTKRPCLVLRPGGLSIEKIRKFINIGLHPALLKKAKVDKPESPGMKYRHYAPKAKLIVLEGEEGKVKGAIEQLLFEINDAGLKTSVLTIGKKEFGADCSINLGEKKEEIAKNLFKALRACDDMKVDVIIAEAISRKGLGLAIMNRLEKAAYYHVIRI